MDMRIRVFNVAFGPTNGTSSIVVRIPVSTKYTFVWNPALTSTTVGAVDNSKWTYSSTFTNHVFTLTNPSADFIAGFGDRFIGLKGTFNSGSSTGTETVTASVVAGSGGELNGGNNNSSITITYF
jgi:hypothetical protein